MRLLISKKGDLTVTEIIGIILLLIFLVWAIFFNNEIRGAIGRALSGLFGFFR